jgi:GNAT superfamily N-acetyltransferase
MPFEILPATKDDAPAFADIFLSAFSDDFNRRLFPPSQNVREWWIGKFTADFDKPQSNDVLLKAVDRTESGLDTIAAFAIWNLPPPDPGAVNQCHEETPQWPDEADKELCNWFFSKMTGQRVRFVDGRRHYCMFISCFPPAMFDSMHVGMLIAADLDLDMLGTHPDYHGRGMGSQLLKWGLEKADRDGLEAYLSASPAGRPLYEKNGFELVDSEELLPGYVQSYMLRPGKGTG